MKGVRIIPAAVPMYYDCRMNNDTEGRTVQSWIAVVKLMETIRSQQTPFFLKCLAEMIPRVFPAEDSLLHVESAKNPPSLFKDILQIFISVNILLKIGNVDLYRC